VTKSGSREIGAIVLITIFLFIVFAFLSHPVSGVFSEEYQDVMGPLGNKIIGFLLLIFGFGSWVLLILPLGFGVYFIIKKESNLSLSRLIWICPAFFSIIVGLHLGLFQGGIKGDKFLPGGLLGRYIGELLRSFLSIYGTWLFITTLLIISLSFLLNISPSVSFYFIAKLFRQGIKIIGYGIRIIGGLLGFKKEEPMDISQVDVRLKKVRSSKTPNSLKTKREEKRPPSKSGYSFPPLDLLNPISSDSFRVDESMLKTTALRLQQTLKDYGITGSVTGIEPGPVITMYEFSPSSGTKLSKIVNLANDLAMALEALHVRIVAPIPGKGVVGFEIPNPKREMVLLREILEDPRFAQSKSYLTLGLGKDIVGRPYITNLSRMPHLLIAGTTGSGKSVAINAMLLSILYRSTPQDVKIIVIDPKRIELSIYKDIPHLLLPVVVDPRQAANALKWTVEEMERRYHLFAELGVRDIKHYNKKLEKRQPNKIKIVVKSSDGSRKEVSSNLPNQDEEKLPYIVVVIDELSDLMMAASRDVEWAITRLAQMARACGIHLIVATQRPSVNVITGLIKANFPARISFRVSSLVDSRTILDQPGAERLLGNGDMLLLIPGTATLERLHGAFVSREEIERVTNYLKSQEKPKYNETILKLNKEPKKEEIKDPLYEQAILIVKQTRQASISMIQRKLKIGYNRAARLIENMEKEGLVGPPNGIKPREVFM
jgi:S-DNA-T family DNA segregation ATPase FtsK/SpoIIIE